MVRIYLENYSGDSQGYDIDSFDNLKSIKDNSELFVIWLIGEAYEN